jgi:hypothetical protein
MVKTTRAQREALWKVFQRDFPNWLTPTKRASHHGSVVKVPSTTLADLLTPLLVANPSSAMRAPLLWWLGDKFENGLTHGGQCRLRWRPFDSFFPALLF